ncbi:MAG: MaoC family dehydratase, partial [Acidobacteriota bacterium]
MQIDLDTLRTAQDLDLGESEWIPVSQERIEAFADATEDHQWIHVEPERAARSQFGTTIAHGYLLLSLVPKLFGQLFQMRDVEMIVNYGLDKVRFIMPVPSGDEVRLQATLLEAKPKGDGFLARIRNDLILRSTGRRAMMAEALFLVLPSRAPEVAGKAP